MDTPLEELVSILRGRQDGASRAVQRAIDSYGENPPVRLLILAGHVADRDHIAASRVYRLLEPGLRRRLADVKVNGHRIADEPQVRLVGPIIDRERLAEIRRARARRMKM